MPPIDTKYLTPVPQGYNNIPQGVMHIWVWSSKVVISKRQCLSYFLARAKVMLTDLRQHKNPKSSSKADIIIPPSLVGEEIPVVSLMS
jgi:hypothetical protein